MTESVISRLDELGVTLFRVNLSHTRLDELPELISFIQRHTLVPICLDTEGAQVRNGPLIGGEVVVQEQMTISAKKLNCAGDDKCFSFYPEFVVDLLEVGDFISIDFNAVLVQVIERTAETAVMRVLNGGVMGQNKAVTIKRHIELPPLTDKDRASIAIGRKMGLTHFALSFAGSGENVDLIRELCGPTSFVISKIESIQGLTNLSRITQNSDAILIDRGDLSREVPIERIPSIQRHIILNSNTLQTPVYVATNLLESMVTQPGPTRAEVNDIFMTLETGADGLVLAAETAIGRRPTACASVVVKVIHAFENKDEDILSMAREQPLLLTTPHGGELVSRLANKEDVDSIKDCRSFVVANEELLDCEQIADGTFSPLTGFMGKETLESVLIQNQLPSGVIWTMPIILQITAPNTPPRINERAILTGKDGIPHSIIDVSEIYEVDLEKIVKLWFGTNDLNHPGVSRITKGGNMFVAGDITLIRKCDSLHSHYTFSPIETRLIFAHKGWTKVVGFHTRNPAHRVHEYIQMAALEKSYADGIYISPVTGLKKKGDFLPEPIFQSYNALIQDKVYPEASVLLGGFATYSRFCGPREAVFTALARKNLGCSHFIVGRDHAGVGDYYDGEANKSLFERIGDIGIEPIFFDAIGYNKKMKCYLPKHPSGNGELISGTEARNTLRNGGVLPTWFMRPSVQKVLRDHIASSTPTFHT